MEVLRFADGDERLHLVNEVGEVILDNGPASLTWTLAKPGWPWGCPLRAAIHPAQKKKPANNSREFKMFPTRIAALDTLSPARPY